MANDLFLCKCTFLTNFLMLCLVRNYYFKAPSIFCRSLCYHASSKSFHCSHLMFFKAKMHSALTNPSVSYTHQDACWMLILGPVWAFAVSSTSRMDIRDKCQIIFLQFDIKWMQQEQDSREALWGWRREVEVWCVMVKMREMTDRRRTGQQSVGCQAQMRDAAQPAP